MPYNKNDSYVEKQAQDLAKSIKKPKIEVILVQVIQLLT